jgi:hypothetical protein
MKSSAMRDERLVELFNKSFFALFSFGNKRMQKNNQALPQKEVVDAGIKYAKHMSNCHCRL